MMPAAPVVLAAPDGEGFHVPTIVELFEFIPFATFDVAGITFRFDFTIVILWTAIILLSALFLGAFVRASVVPRGLQNMMEAGIDLIREQIVTPVLGSDGEKWMPFLTTIFFFVFGLNIWGIIPFVNFPITSRMAYPAFLAGLIWIVYNYVGIKNQGPIGYFKNIMFPPGVPIPVYIILTPIELFSTLIVRPVTLAVRLFANMMAGHVMLAIFFLATGFFLYRADAVPLMLASPLPFVVSIGLIGFELFISGVQAFIMTILAAVYISSATHPEH